MMTKVKETTLYDFKGKARQLVNEIDQLIKQNCYEESDYAAERVLREVFSAGKQEGWDDHKELGVLS
jgi:hypothetical protein